jgi:hypothetical protein
MKKLQEFQKLMSDLSTTAQVSVDAWTVRFLYEGDLERVLERVGVDIHFTIPGKKTHQCMDKDQLVRFLTDRYNVAETEPQVVALLQRLDNEKAAGVAAIVADIDKEEARQAEYQRVRSQFPKNVSELELMQDILRLRTGEVPSMDTELIAELRLQVARLDAENKELRDKIDDLDNRRDAAAVGEGAAQTLTTGADSAASIAGA